MRQKKKKSLQKTTESLNLSCIVQCPTYPRRGARPGKQLLEPSETSLEKTNVSSFTVSYHMQISFSLEVGTHVYSPVSVLRLSWLWSVQAQCSHSLWAHMCSTRPVSESQSLCELTCAAPGPWVLSQSLCELTCAAALSCGSHPLRLLQCFCLLFCLGPWALRREVWWRHSA